jgi:hypothetical protein
MFKRAPTHIKRINQFLLNYQKNMNKCLKKYQCVPSSGVFPQTQWGFLVLLSGVFLNFPDLGLLENAELQVQQLSVAVSDNYRDKENHLTKTF